jgi:hypothetical protein
VIVRKSVDIDENDDNIEDVSVEDIDSDIESSDDAMDMKREIDVIEHSPPPPKRRKLQQPKRQRGNKPIEVPKDENGQYIFPVQIGRTLLLSLGNIIPNENFYNQNYIFPVGYSIQRYNAYSF